MDIILIIIFIKATFTFILSTISCIVEILLNIIYVYSSILKIILLCNLLGYLLLLVTKTTNFFKIMLIFELSILIFTLILLIYITENPDYLVLLKIVLGGVIGFLALYKTILFLVNF